MRFKMMMTLTVLLASNAAVDADGGTVRFSERRGNRRITVFTAPTPLCAGPVDVSVLVQDAESGKPLMDMPITVLAHPLDNSLRSISAATSEAAANKLMRSAPLVFAEPGWWHVEVIVSGEAIAFDVEVGDAPPEWIDMVLWIGWPFAVIGIFAVHQWRSHRRVPSAA